MVKGDLIVTSGMDGIFPKGLPVAIISKVYPLDEGAVTFNFEADLCAGDLRELGSVGVLPPEPYFQSQ